MRVIQGRCDGRGRVARARPWLHCADQTARGWRDRWCWCWCWCGVRGARESGRAAGSSEEQGRGTRSGAAQLVLRAGDASINQWLSVRPVGSGRRETGDGARVTSTGSCVVEEDWRILRGQEGPGQTT